MLRFLLPAAVAIAVLATIAGAAAQSPAPLAPLWAVSPAGAFGAAGAVSSRAISLAEAASRGVSGMRWGVTVRRGDGNGWSNNVHPGGDP